MIHPGIFSRFCQTVHFSRSKPDNLLLTAARFYPVKRRKNVTVGSKQMNWATEIRLIY